MKRKNLFKFTVVLALIVSAVTFTSCSKDDNSKGENEDEGPIKTEGPAPFQHKVLVEDFTGGWCGWCPLVAHAIEKLEEEHSDKFQAIAIHNQDSFDFFPKERSAMEREVKVNGYPFALINRTINFREDESRTIREHLVDGSPIGVKINSNLKIDSGTVDISIKLAKTYETGLKYMIFILEDGLIASQANYTEFYIPKKTNPEFVHNNTLIAIPNGFRGDFIDSAITSEGNEIKINGTQVAYKAQKVENLKVVVVVADASNKILNTVVAKANKNQDYQLKTGK